MSLTKTWLFGPAVLTWVAIKLHESASTVAPAEALRRDPALAGMAIAAVSARLRASGLRSMFSSSQVTMRRNRVFDVFRPRFFDIRAIRPLANHGRTDLVRT